MLFDHIEEKEAVKSAALIEHNGHRFYKLLAKKTHSDSARDIFEKLAADEDNHLKELEEKFFPEAGFTDQITDEELAIEDYLERAGMGDIFTRRIDVETLVNLIDSPKKALTVALDTERHAVQHFEEMARRFQTPEGRKMCQDLAEEEKEHVNLITGLLTSLE